MYGLPWQAGGAQAAAPAPPAVTQAGLVVRPGTAPSTLKTKEVALVALDGYLVGTRALAGSC